MATQFDDGQRTGSRQPTGIPPAVPTLGGTGRTISTPGDGSLDLSKLAALAQ